MDIVDATSGNIHCMTRGPLLGYVQKGGRNVNRLWDLINLEFKVVSESDRIRSWKVIEAIVHDLE